MELESWKIQLLLIFNKTSEINRYEIITSQNIGRLWYPSIRTELSSTFSKFEGPGLYLYTEAPFENTQISQFLTLEI